MSYLPHSETDFTEMLATIGVESIDDLFAMIPREDRIADQLNLPPALSELELAREVDALADAVFPATKSLHFLGGGFYDHFIPAVVDHLASNPQFVTAYTPYQAEASQGSLQAFFEYQTLITRLTGMAISNASQYDGATACVEAVLMSLAGNKRSKIIVPETLHPEYRDVLKTYLQHRDVVIEVIPTPSGILEPNLLQKAIDANTAAVLVQHPNFFGNLESVQELVKTTHESGALFIMCVDPISMGILVRPGDLGADLVVAEGQSLGIPMSYGGPGLGILAANETMLRKMPGRLVGQTKDRNGNTCWVLTMQTREQHIRREKATSNICSNQGLMAIRAMIYMAALGPRGLREVAEISTRNAHYLAEQLCEQTSLKLAFPNVPFFKEFVVRIPQKISAQKMLNVLWAEHHIHGGIALSRFGMANDLLLVAVTEKRTSAEIDLFVQKIRQIESRY
ncbi:MAG: aminomethyl-transferring glycine dehydrogenase subunit GcvPA [Thermoguttaceae bacterium]